MATEVAVATPVATTVEAWLEACSDRALEPRLTAKPGAVTLRAGDVAYQVVQPDAIEAVRTAMESFKGDPRWLNPASGRNGYSSCQYLLRLGEGTAQQGAPRNGGTVRTQVVALTPEQELAKARTDLATARQLVSQLEDKVEALSPPKTALQQLEEVRTARERHTAALTALDTREKHLIPAAKDERKKLEADLAAKATEMAKVLAEMQAQLAAIHEENAKAEAPVAPAPTKPTK